MGVMKRIATQRGGHRGGLSVTRMFFDRRAVKDAMDATTHKAMSIGAARIRKRAQRSMKTVSDKKPSGSSPGGHTPSRPGSPPVAVRQHPWVKKFLLYYYDRPSQTAVIGPVGFPSGRDAPHQLEFGGRIRVRNQRRRFRRVGDGGEVRVGGPVGRTTKMVVDQAGRPTGQWVTYMKLRSEQQARRANQINQRLYGPTHTVHPMAARPFMGPALKAEMPALAGLWSSSVKA